MNKREISIYFEIENIMYDVRVTRKIFVLSTSMSLYYK